MDAPIEVTLHIKEFLQIENCPDEWRRLNLYILRDDELVLYVGQSYVAFHRVWEHYYGGFKGRSLVGRFIICNWPVSMHFTLDLLTTRNPRFECVEHDRDRCEQMLIEQYTPCLNTIFNPHPTPLPEKYRSPYTSLKFSHHPRKMIQQAAQVIQAEQKKAWLANPDAG